MSFSVGTRLPTALLSLLAVGLTSFAGTSAPSAASAPAPAPLAPGVTAYYEMNEAANTTVMYDSGPQALHATVDPAGVQSGFGFAGATGYRWVYRPPEQAPPSPERVIQVPDHPNLEPGSGPFTIELRYRTKENFGNITQKGQAATQGGQWKIQSPGGVPSCLFKGSTGQVATGAITPLNDEEWHNLTCAYTSAGVTMYVDGEFRNRKNGTAGTINNGIPMTIGGKINCDQVDITCDYFSGAIDFVKITKAANLLPTAAYTSSCFGTVCAFDSSGSADADGSLTRYAWDFGDGQTSTEANPSHTYAAPGSYTVRLTVTDNQAAADPVTQQVLVEDTTPESPVGLVDSRVVAANNATPRLTVPPTAQPGDRLVMVLSHNNLSRTVGTPTGVTGWTRLDSVAADTMGSTAWTKVVAAADPGAAVTAPLSGSAKYTLTLATYTGVQPSVSLPFAVATNASTVASRLTPAIAAPAGSWVVSAWADKSGTTTAWTPAPSVVSRSAACNADGGRICTLLADSGGPVPAATYGPIEASTNAPSDAATTWSFVLPPDTGAPPPNQPPSAAFTWDCDTLTCGFDSSESEDLDGGIASYAWDFGDGTTSSQASPQHAFDAPGSYQVSLIVTDDDGDSDTIAHAVEVDDGTGTAVAQVGSGLTAASSSAPSVALPNGVAVGDRLVLALSLNNTSRTFTGPSGAGWSQLGNVVADDLRTVMWTKVVQAGDPGTAVSVPLSGTAKSTLTVAAYRGVASGPLTVAGASDLGNKTTRVTPTVTAPSSAWIVSYWADKSSTTTAWTAAGSVASRQAGCNADTGRVCSLLADSNGPVAGGVQPGVTASTNAASSKATVWSVVLPPA